MSEYLIQGETLTAIADEVRTLSGATDELTTEEMKTNINTANSVIDNQADLLAQIQSALEGKVAGGSADPVLQEKTATPTTSSQTITPDSGYDGLSKVTVNAMPTATQASPSISVSSAGLITASATQSAGYVSAGTKSATKQLTTQAAKTVTPTTSNQTAVASGRYTTGAITVKGDANLKADNITQGISIFGVAGANPYEKNATTVEVNTQASKLDELKTILAGKATGGGGAVETCTVKFGVQDSGLNPEPPIIKSVSLTRFVNGTFEYEYIFIDTLNLNGNVVIAPDDVIYTTYNDISFSALTIPNCYVGGYIEISANNLTGYKYENCTVEEIEGGGSAELRLLLTSVINGEARIIVYS